MVSNVLILLPFLSTFSMKHFNFIFCVYISLLREFLAQVWDCHFFYFIPHKIIFGNISPHLKYSTVFTCKHFSFHCSRIFLNICSAPTNSVLSLPSCFVFKTVLHLPRKQIVHTQPPATPQYQQTNITQLFNLK